MPGLVCVLPDGSCLATFRNQKTIDKISKKNHCSLQPPGRTRTKAEGSSLATFRNQKTTDKISKKNHCSLQPLGCTRTKAEGSSPAGSSLATCLNQDFPDFSIARISLCPAQRLVPRNFQESKNNRQNFKKKTTARYNLRVVHGQKPRAPARRARASQPPMFAACLLTPKAGT